MRHRGKLSRALGRCVVLCGHSLGCAVARCLAQQLRVCGADARGLMAMDARTPAPWPSLFPAAELHVAAPLAPAAREARGAPWARVARGLGLAAELGARSWRHLLDAQHHDLPATDLAELLRSAWWKEKRPGARWSLQIGGVETNISGLQRQTISSRAECAVSMYVVFMLGVPGAAHGRAWEAKGLQLAEMGLIYLDGYAQAVPGSYKGNSLQRTCQSQPETLHFAFR